MARLIVMSGDGPPGPSVDLGTAKVGDGYAFGLSDPRSGAPHLLGRAAPG